MALARTSRPQKRHLNPGPAETRAPDAFAGRSPVRSSGSGQRFTCSVNVRVITAPEPLVTRSVNDALDCLVGVPDTVAV